MRTILALSIVALLFVPTLSFDTGRAHTGDIDRIAPSFHEKLADALISDRFDIIVRFDSPAGEHAALLSRLGLETDIVLDSINAASMEATKAQILDLSRAEGVVYIECDEPLAYFMEVSAVAIGASSIWNYAILDDGEVVYDDHGYMKRIDGRGVTAVVLDTGIDAGHPDLDYGTKTIKNEKREESGWTEMENSDTSSGHGTHCAGTVAGNGDASAGQRRGVAPGANLYGMSTGEGLSIIYAVEALERVYQQSRPNENPYNIRVVSNSWGTSGDRYDPNGAITQIVEKLVYENHVAVVFAAGNDGGDGSDIRTNPYSNIPASIGVAAALRDGTGIADFSSRGHRDIQETWPDVAAPGVDIWSTAPRGTLIDGSQRPTDDDLYYMAISGTSMATPHVTGVVALLYQAAPSLGVSPVHEDYSGGEGAPPASEWYNDTTTLVSEAELILEATADYIEPPAEGVPSGNWTNDHGHRFDFAQGCGLVNVTRAVKVALALERLRTYDGDGDGRPDRPDVTVFEALEQMNISYRRYVQVTTDRLRTRWHGEWAHLVRQDVHPTGNQFYATNATVLLRVPQGTTRLTVVFDYEQASAVEYYLSNLDLAIDWDGDGVNDFPVPTSVDEGVKTYEIDVTPDMTERLWRFWVDGEATGTNVGDEYFEPTVNFQVSVTAALDGAAVIVSLQSDQTEVRWFEFGKPSGPDVNTTVYLETWVLDPSSLVPRDVETRRVVERREVLALYPILIAFIVALALGAIGGFLLRRRRGGSDVEVLEMAPEGVPVGEPASPPPTGGMETSGGGVDGPGAPGLPPAPAGDPADGAEP